MRPDRWAPEETVTTRRVMAGRRRLVRAKWPRWLVPNCSSKPSAVRDSGGIITPALLMSRSTGCPAQSRAKARTESRLARSSGRTSFSAEAGRVPAAAAPLASSRTARITRAPCPASALAVSRPMPLLAPVTMTVWPARSGMSAAVKPLIGEGSCFSAPLGAPLGLSRWR